MLKLVMIATIALAGWSASEAAAVRRVAGPHFNTEVLAFEDTFLYGTPAEGSLIYRAEGDGGWKRSASGRDRGLSFTGGAVSLVHPAQYDRPALRVRLLIESGEPGIAICHNGIRDNSGAHNPSPGLEIVPRERDTAIRDLRTGKILATIPEALPRGKQTELTIAWDVDERTVRVDLPQASYQLTVAAGLSRGGFALRAPSSPKTSYVVTRVQVLWQDQRTCMLYDRYDTIYDRHGELATKLPSVKLPDGNTNYATCSVDLRRERSLIVFGGPDLNCDKQETFKGWAVRDLATGKLDVLALGQTVNGCAPYQGGGSMDGYWLMQSWVCPASLSWIDWNAYARGDKAGFITPAKAAVTGEGTFTGYHDPSNALDGSIARYLRITESWRGVNHFTVHPNLAPYAPFADFAMPGPTHPKVSHTGPAGMPTQLVVRDGDRAWYEQWACLGNVLHVQNRGYNLFARSDDWEGPFYSVEKDAPAFRDYANQSPDLLRAGRLNAPYYRFAPTAPPEERIKWLGTYWLKMGKQRYIVDGKLPTPPGVVPFQVLMDRIHRD